MRLPCLLASLLVALPLAAPARPGATARTLWTGPAGSTVYAAPSSHAAVQAILPTNQPLRVDVAGATWGRTLLWNAVPAWVPLASLRAQPGSFTTSTTVVPQPPHRVGPHRPMPLVARGRLREAVYVRAAPAFSAVRLRVLQPGTTLPIRAWATDAGDAAWYQVAGAAGGGWVYGDAVTFVRALPARPASLLAPLRGKGMWLTYPLLKHSPVAAIIAAARAAGLTHLYVEVGRSRDGFYGARGLAALLPAAHRAGIRVMAWVYPFLANLPADVALSIAAARYVAPSGDQPDGLLADVEQFTDEGSVRAYGQVLRALLGPDEPMAVATFPPQSVPGRTYPFATVALSWNAIVPMDYWHLQIRPYSADEAYRYVRDSVRLIRAETRTDEPVEVLGQMFDWYQTGVNSPSAAEIAACAAAARDSGAVGVSFFEWNHATQEEWGTIAAIHQ